MRGTLDIDVDDRRQRADRKIAESAVAVKQGSGVLGKDQSSYYTTGGAPGA